MCRNSHGLSTGTLPWWDIMKWPSVSISDYQSVKNKSTKAEAVSFLIAKSDKVKYKNNVANDAPVAAVTDDLEKVVLFEIAKGRYFSPFEYSSGNNVAVLELKLLKGFLRMLILLARR